MKAIAPLSLNGLNKWRHYDKAEARKNNNGGRVYPVDDLLFDAWIKLDFDGDGKPDYKSPYQLRKELAEEKLDLIKRENRFKLGRALYHIAQRRGFKSSRKGDDDVKEKETSDDNDIVDLQYSERKKNKNIIELFEKYHDAKTIGSLFASLENDGIRIRESIAQYAIRENFKDEIKYIFQIQGLSLQNVLYTKLVEKGKNKNDGSIFYKRPLRSQKGLIGKCTLEPSKYRAPINHPSFETFRAWSFLNNIKFKPSEDKDAEWQPLNLELKNKIYSKLFFRKKAYFPFSDITDFLQKEGKKWHFNYKPKTTVTGCPVSARLKDLFGDEYLTIKIPKTPSAKSKKDHYNIEDIWHVLFSYEDQEYVSEFAEIKLGLSAEQVKQFVTMWNATPVGYAMLSLNAINKINIFLQKGLIYTEAVLLANVPDIIGKELWAKNEQLFINEISNVIDSNRHQKIILNTVNNLVSKHKSLEDHEKFGYKDSNYKLTESDFNSIEETIKEQFGANKWSRKSKTEQEQITNTVKDCYQAYFKTTGFERKDINNERYFVVKSHDTIYYKSDSGYYRLPKLIDTLAEFLQLNFNVSDDQVKKIYHPSEINIYPPAKADKDGVIKLGSPKTGSFKNPMAMRALHELRKLINYMIETNQIDNDTRIVVEVARELNDSNKRWAIEAWQKQREAENQEFAEAITLLLEEKASIAAEPSNESDIDKVRLFYEQNTEQTLPAIAGEDEKGKKRKTSDEAVRWNGHGKKLIEKYRLWKEQGYLCFYTGKFIKLTDLFDENVIDFEHTLPRSKSFDNSLANLTVCYHDYNRTIKKNQIPTQLNNYNQDFDFGGSIGMCKAILPRLDHWKEKVERIKQQIDFWSTKSKKAADKGWKDDAIRQRHLWLMELDYWRNKVDRFRMEEITSGFKNSQKVDTQLISKYAFHYLKTYFEKVDVQKGSITAEFRKIYGLQIPDIKKDRSKHSHHAKDAAVLTLIPVAAKRDELLKSYYEHQERRQSFSAQPYKGFKREFVWNIDDSILINNIAIDQTLTPAKRIVRKRGKVQLIEGTSHQKIATGNTVRGQLHDETFFGAIKPAKRGEKGNILRDEEGKIIQEDKVRYVVRVPFQYKAKADSPGFKTLEEIEKQIVDEGLKEQIRKQVEKAGGLKEAFEQGIYMLNKNGEPVNKIRHIRIFKAASEPLQIKTQTNLSKFDYKQFYYATNATNSYFALYKEKNEIGFAFRNLFETAQLLTSEKIKTPKGLFEELIQTKKGKEKIDLKLKYILKNGTKVIFIKDQETIENIRSLTIPELSTRLYQYTNYEKNGNSARLNFKYHLDARNDKEISEEYIESEIDFNNPKPTLRFAYSKYNFLVEGYDFKIEMDGTIHWLQKN
jgi:CRISPR-associated endonuclease Csn1